MLLDELGAHLDTLVDRPRVVVGSKVDVAAPGADTAACELVVSSTRGDGIDALVSRLAALVTEARAEASASVLRAPRVHRPRAEEVEVRAVGQGRFEVVGRAAVRAVGLSDLTDPGALDELHRRLARLGVDRALARAGARDGDVVVDRGPRARVVARGRGAGGRGAWLTASSS